MAKTEHLTHIDVLVSRSNARIRCVAGGQEFDRSGPLEQVLADWKTFINQLPAERRGLARSAMEFAKAGSR